MPNLFEFFFHNKFIINPITRFISHNLGNFAVINELKREVPIIVSISTNEDDFSDLELSLYSIFCQSILPDKIILWISNEYKLSELPYAITRYIKNGLEIRFVEDKDNFTNAIYALKEYPSAIIITAEKDIYYQKDWLKKLYHSYISNPEDIHVHRAMRIKTNNSGIANYKEWKQYPNMEKAFYEYFPVSTGGVLYPPNCFVKEIFREDIYKKITNSSWDIWSWFIALVSGRKIRLIRNHDKVLTCINIFKRFKNELSDNRHSGEKDIQIDKLMEFYKENINPKLSLD